jgi:phage terminase small subunit
MNIPEGLQETGKRFYEQVLVEYDMGDAHDKARLVMACRCLDEIAHDEALIEKQGRFIKDRFQQVKEHPAGRAIRENKTLFCRIIREIGLDITAPPDSRPPRQY